MAAPRKTVWELEPHTRAKHEILRRYLQAWMVILSQGRFPEILYIDGFAGPGEYAGGETGSPITPLFEEEGNLRGSALIAHSTRPFDEHRKSISFSSRRRMTGPIICASRWR